MKPSEIYYWCGLAETIGDSKKIHFVRQLTTVLSYRAEKSLKGQLSEKEEEWLQQVVALLRDFVITKSEACLNKIQKDFWNLKV